MNTENKKEGPNKPTGRRYSSVEDLMRSEDVIAEVQEKFAEIENATRVVEQLCALRQTACLTQDAMATHLNCTQSAVSKLESGRDEDVTIGQIAAYAEASGQRIGVVFGKPLNHVESVKAHAFGMKHHLSSLASLAHKGEDMRLHIQAFFGEAFFNILSILSGCQEKMPENALEVRLEVLGSPTSVSQRVNRLERGREPSRTSECQST